MKTLRAMLGRSKGRLTGLAVLAAALIIPAGLMAWGPDRPTYTLEEPADHVTFNSITNNAKHGDERNFVQIREAGVGNYGEEVQIEPGKEYEVYVFYHNNAKEKLNTEEFDYKGIAQNAKMRVQMPASVKQGEKARITGVISADNAQPGEVWDEAYGVSTADVALRYVPESAKITSLGAVNGQTMPNSLFTTGALLGYDQLDGTLPGCNPYSGYVIFRFKAVQPNFEVKKEVSKTGQNDYTKSVEVKDGETVDYKIQYTNTGSVQQDNVVIKDTLPKGVSYIPGSTHVATSKTNGQWQNIPEDDVVADGINIGSYAPEGNAYVKFSAKVDKLDELDCGPNKLTNVAEAQTDNGNKSDTADVVVNKDCEEQPEPKNIEVCRLSDKKVITINESEFDSSKHSRNLNDCKESNTEVCRVSDKTIITIKESEFDSSIHSRNLADCDEAPTTPAPEKEMCEVPGKEHLPKDSPECVSAPAELPQTGGFDTLSILGLGALTISTGYYLASRRVLG